MEKVGARQILLSRIGFHQLNNPRIMGHMHDQLSLPSRYDINRSKSCHRQRNIFHLGRLQRLMEMCSIAAYSSSEAALSEIPPSPSQLCVKLTTSAQASCPSISKRLRWSEKNIYRSCSPKMNAISTPNTH